ncbi:uncharacterized protein LOC132700875 [Cylas formicarius]|uniref:uncharacterized protein LOC132700875 n=1 Tax=Cylas formicarius TaxID=197179 RepID=UPI002958DDD8|nr:uncharacterized protein LOC132700875 [Cylas formicarius]
MFFPVLFGFCLFLFFAYNWPRRHLYVAAARLPGPPAVLPLVGNGFSFMCRIEDLLKRWLKITEKYPSPSRVWLGPKLVVSIKDADHLQIVLQSSKISTKGFVYNFLEPFMGQGLFTSRGVKHKTQRRLLQPLFGTKVLDGYAHFFQKHAENLVKLLDVHVDGNNFDVLYLLHEIAFEATMDILLEDKNDHNVDYRLVPGYIRRFYQIFTERVVSFWLYSNLIFKLTPMYKEQEEMVKVVTTLTQDVTNERVPEIIRRMETDSEFSNERSKMSPSVLERMLELVRDNPECLSEEEFRDHILTFAGTSQDTQTSVVAFTLMMLGMHPNIQDKVVEEIREIMGDRRQVYFDDTGKLKYMEMCLKEAMRLFPVGPFLPRDVLEDFELDKYKIPKGCSLILGIYEVHRDARHWEKPDRFYPEHFDSEQAAKRHPYAYLPFSAGPRRCIAQHYSYVNMKVLLTNILINYVVECEGCLDDLELMTDVSIRPKNGYQIKIKRRTGYSLLHLFSTATPLMNEFLVPNSSSMTLLRSPESLSLDSLEVKQTHLECICEILTSFILCTYKLQTNWVLPVSVVSNCYSSNFMSTKVPRRCNTCATLKQAVVVKLRHKRTSKQRTRMITTYLEVIALVLLAVLLVYYNWKRRHLYWAASKLPGPFAFPIIGNAHKFMCKNEEVLMRIYELMKLYSDVPVRFWLGNKLLISFNNPNHAEKIMSSPKFAHKHDLYEFIKPYLGEGLVTGSGALYKQHRRIIQPIFDLKFAHECVCIMQKHINICMDKLEEFVDKGTFNYGHVVHKCMVDIIQEILFGIDAKVQQKGYKPFDQAMIDVYNFGFTRLVKPWLHPDIIFNNSPLKARQDQLRKTLRKLTQDIIDASYKRRKITKTVRDFPPVVDRLADFIEDNPGIIDSETFIDHLLTLHAAAEDTLTIISSFTSVCLGMYPEHQQKAAAEVREVFGETPRPVTPEDLTKLPYLSMCIKDAQRLFPIAPYILRRCTEDFELEDKWLIPKDSAIVVAIFNIHRDPRYWDNPHHFHPDHFLPEKVKGRHVYAFVPFSAGPRGCIGKILANTGLKIFLSNLLQRFEIEAEGQLPDLPLRMDISVRPKRGYFLSIKKRVWK